MTEERLAEIKHNYENACGVAYERWDYSQGYPPGKMFDYDATEDMLELITEVERLDGEITDREESHIALYNDNVALKEEIARLRKALEFYADGSNYGSDIIKTADGQTSYWQSVVEFDAGFTAKEVLSDDK